MSDMIWNNRFAERGEEKLSWHQLGHNRAEGWPDATTALRDIDADYEVVTVPHWYVSPSDGTQRESNTVEIVRPAWHGEPEHSFGQATKAFKPLQNREVCGLLDGIAKEWTVETIGAIRDGQDLFVTLNAGSVEIGGDEHRKYLFAWNTHDATGAFKVFITPVRVVCWNTCVMGENAASTSIRVRHTQDVYQQAQFAVETTVRIKKLMDQSISNLDRLTQFSLNPLQVKEIVEQLYPLKDIDARIASLEQMGEVLTDQEKAKLSDLKVKLANDRVSALQHQIQAIQLWHKFNDEYPSMARTAYSVFCAMTELECWKDSHTSERSTAQATLVGARAKKMAEAYDLIIATR